MFANFKKNFKPIIGSVLIAIILWFMVATEKEYSHQIEAPITIKRLAKGKTLLEKIPESAKIELQGKGKSFIGLWFYDINFGLELPDIEKSQKVQLINYINFLDLPATFGLQVIDIIEPSIIDLKIDDYVIEKKPIFLAGNVGTEDGYTLLAYRFSIDSIEVSGPKTLVKKSNYILTQSLNLKDQKSSFKQHVSLISPNSDLVDINPKNIIVEFDIQRLVERTVYEIPISVLNVPSHLKVETVPNTLSLRIKGGEKIVASVLPEQIKAQIDFAKSYKRNKDSYAAHIITPDNISWIESIPKSFKLIVMRK